MFHALCHDDDPGGPQGRYGLPVKLPLSLEHLLQCAIDGRVEIRRLEIAELEVAGLRGHPWQQNVYSVGFKRRGQSATPETPEKQAE